MKVRRQSKQPVTLIELILVTVIIALISSVVALNVYRLVVEQRFRSEAAQLVDLLGLAQSVMVMNGTDVTVELKPVSEGFLVKLTSPIPFPKNVRNLITKEALFTHIHSIDFDDQNFKLEGEVLKLRFLSGGSMMSKGVLHLSDSETGKGALNTYILLRGYPAPILSYQQEQKLPDEENELELFTNYMMEEVSQDEKAQEKE